MKTVLMQMGDYIEMVFSKACNEIPYRNRYIKQDESIYACTVKDVETGSSIVVTRKTPLSQFRNWADECHLKIIKNYLYAMKSDYNSYVYTHTDCDRVTFHFLNETTRDISLSYNGLGKFRKLMKENNLVPIYSTRTPESTERFSSPVVAYFPQETLDNIKKITLSEVDVVGMKLTDRISFCLANDTSITIERELEDYAIYNLLSKCKKEVADEALLGLLTSDKKIVDKNIADAEKEYKTRIKYAKGRTSKLKSVAKSNKILEAYEIMQRI